jgi:hypothetical protein
MCAPTKRGIQPPQAMGGISGNPRTSFRLLGLAPNATITDSHALSFSDYLESPERSPDNQNDDARSREIVKAAVVFMKTHLCEPQP